MRNLLLATDNSGNVLPPNAFILMQPASTTVSTNLVTSQPQHMQSVAQRPGVIVEARVKARQSGRLRPWLQL